MWYRGVQILYFIDSIIGRSFRETAAPAAEIQRARARKLAARWRDTRRRIMKGPSTGHKLSNNSVIVVPLTVKRCGRAEARGWYR